MLNPIRMLLAFGLMYLTATGLGFASYLLFNAAIMWLCVFLLMPIVAALLVWRYLDQVRCPFERSLGETLKLVGAWIVLSFALDAFTYVLLVPRWQHRPAAWMFFRDQSPWIWLSYAVLLASAFGGRTIFLYVHSKNNATLRRTKLYPVTTTEKRTIISMRKLGLAALVMLSLLPAMSAQRSAAEPVSALYTASLHTFSVLRSGVSINDPVTGVQHAASHTQDATLAGTSDHRDLTGGWYNAGDYGKWSNTTAIAVSYMLHLYRIQERAAGSDRSRHPPDPELLEQARWGLAWMLKMQDVDGGVRHKVDGATQASLSAAWGKPPELDPNLRIAATAATGSTADFAAVMYQAAQFFGSRDRKVSLRLTMLVGNRRRGLGNCMVRRQIAS